MTSIIDNQSKWHWKKILFRAAAVIVVAYIILVIARIPHAIEKRKTDEAVAKIHSTKLTLDDVMGKNLPPSPGADADKTVQGIDANHNGIRDDVELAIFKEYPNSAKTRAVLLQYALALQMEVVQSIVNKETATALAEEESRANDCVAETLVPRKSPASSRDYSDIEKIKAYTDSVEKKQFNTVARKKSFVDFNQRVGSFELQSGCHIDSTHFSK